MQKILAEGLEELRPVRISAMIDPRRRQVRSLELGVEVPADMNERPHDAHENRLQKLDELQLQVVARIYLRKSLSLFLRERVERERTVEQVAVFVAESGQRAP